MIAHRTTYGYSLKIANPRDSNNTADAVAPEQWSKLAKKKEAHFPPGMRLLIQDS
jgi:hypothetical protein